MVRNGKYWKDHVAYWDDMSNTKLDLDAVQDRAILERCDNVSAGGTRLRSFILLRMTAVLFN